MWPSTTSYQCDIDESIDGSQTTSSSLVSSIGVIGRKNLRADAPVFKASMSDVTYTTSCEGVIDECTGRLEQEVYYTQSAVNEYPMNERTRSALDQCRLSPESKSSKDFFSPRSQHMFFTHDDRADYSTGCSTGYTRSSRYLTQMTSPRKTGRMLMLQPPLSSPLMISQPPYSYSSPQHPQESRGMGLQIMQDIAQSHMGSTPPRSPSQNSMGSGSSVFSPIAMNVYRDIQPQSQSQSQLSLSLSSPMNSYSREQIRLSQQLISADGYVYQVHFKRAHRNFLLSPSAPRNILPGDFVKVEADRGEDLGVVVSKSLVADFVEFVPTAGYRGRGYSAGLGEKKYIIRFATAEERMLLRNKVEDEERTLQVIREKVLERRLPMAILDAEYQFDHHKLVYFFEADRRIDFRELVSDLFSLYKTRIWMQQVDTSTIPGEEVGLRLAHAAGFLPSSYLNDSDEGGRDWRDRDMDELTQTVSEFAAVQVFQLDEEHHQELYRDRDRERERDGYQAGPPLCSPSHRVDRAFLASSMDDTQVNRTKSLASPDHRSDMKTPFMSPAKSLRAYGIYGTGSMEGREGVINEDEEGGGVQRGVNRERKGAFEGIGGMGGSMGPLLNGAWAYQT